MIYANSPNKIEKIKIVIQMLSPMNGVQKARNFIVMAESARGQDKANPVLLLTTQAILALSGYLALVP